MKAKKGNKRLILFKHLHNFCYIFDRNSWRHQSSARHNCIHDSSTAHISDLPCRQNISQSGRSSYSHSRSHRCNPILFHKDRCSTAPGIGIGTVLWLDISRASSALSTPSTSGDLLYFPSLKGHKHTGPRCPSFCSRPEVEQLHHGRGLVTQLP